MIIRVWDMLHLPAGEGSAAMTFTQGTLLLALALT